jgi:hypothetical protein
MHQILAEVHGGRLVEGSDEYFEQYRHMIHQGILLGVDEGAQCPNYLIQSTEY